MMKKVAVLAVCAIISIPSMALAQPGRWTGYGDPRGIAIPEQSVEYTRTDPKGILRGRGVSSRHGGMGNMGGGTGLSANTGIGLGGIGANQGARF